MPKGLTCLLVDQNPNDGVLLQRELLREFSELSFFQSTPIQPFTGWIPVGVQPRLCIVDWAAQSGQGELFLQELERRWPQTNVLVFCREPGAEPPFASPAYQVSGIVRGVSSNFTDLLEQARAILLKERIVRREAFIQSEWISEPPAPTPGGDSAAWDLVPFGVAMVSVRTHRVLYANRFLCRLLGIPITASRDFRLEDIHPTDAVRKIVAAMRLASRTRTPGSVEAMINPLKGRALNVDVLISQSEGEQTDSVPLYYLDATERRSLERKLRRVADAIANCESGQEFFQRLVTALAMVLEVDMALVGRVRAGAIKPLAGNVDGKLCDHTTMPLTAYPAERVIRRHLICVTKEFRKEFPSANWMIDRKVESYMGLPVTNNAGDVVGIIQVMHRRPLSKTKDLRAVLLIFATRVAAELSRLANEEALLEKERFMRAAESITGMGSWEWSIATDQVRISEEGLRIIGLSPLAPPLSFENAVGLLHPEDQPAGRALVQNAIVSRGSFNEALRLMRAGGETRWLQIQGKVLCDEDGFATRITGVFLDHTEKRKLSRQSEAFLKLGQQLSAAKTKKEAAHIILEVAREILDVEAAAFSLRDSPNSNQFRVVLTVDSCAGEYREFEPFPHPHPPTPLERQILDHGPQMILRTQAEQASQQDATHAFGFVNQRSASILAVPVRYGHECIGFFVIHSYRFQAYSPEDIPLLQSLADHSAGALMRIDAEEEARHMMSRTQVIVDNAAAVVFLKDTEGRYLLVNRKWESVTGIDRKKAIGVHAEELHPVHIARQLLLNDKEVIESRTPIEREEVVEREGRKQVFLVAKSPLFDNKGRVYGLCGVATDITQRKELERSLKELTHRLEVAQRIAKIGNWDWNISTGLSWWSKETFRLFGLPPSDPAPDRAAILAMIHPDDVESVKRAVAKCIADRSPYRMTYRVPQADGTIRVVEVHGEPVLDESGKPYLLVGTIQDVTARERN